MCRFLACLGEPIFLENLVCKPSHSLVRQSLLAVEAKTVTNGDGFGVGWYGKRSSPGVCHGVMPAWSDQNLLALCAERGATVAVAESCSGGLLGSRFTAIPGSSAIFQGGVISYHNDSKTRDLGVHPDTIKRVGAVSEETARAMASGVRQRFGTTIGLAITGIAGPGGGTPEKPVGTVWVAVDLAGEVEAIRAMMPGDRNEMRYRSTQLVLDRLRRALMKLPASAGWTADD